MGTWPLMVTTGENTERMLVTVTADAEEEQQTLA